MKNDAPHTPTDGSDPGLRRALRLMRWAIPLAVLLGLLLPTDKVWSAPMQVHDLAGHRFSGCQLHLRGYTFHGEVITARPLHDGRNWRLVMLHRKRVFPGQTLISSLQCLGSPPGATS